MAASSSFFSARAVSFSRFSARSAGSGAVVNFSFFVAYASISPTQCLHGNCRLGHEHRCVGSSGRPKSLEHAYGTLPDPWHWPNRIVSPASMFSARNLPLATSARPFLVASALGAADSTYASSIAIMLPPALTAGESKRPRPAGQSGPAADNPARRASRFSG